MATPLRSAFLLSPKVLSPFPSPIHKSIVKRLDYTSCERLIPDSSPHNKWPLTLPFSDAKKSKLSVCDNVLLINTPNKLSLLKNGLQKTERITIIGRGSFGTVIKGKYKDEIVAVKIVRSGSSTEELNEANCLNLNHVNIVKTMDLITKSDGFSIILMEYCHGSTNLQNVLNHSDFMLSDGIVLQFVNDLVDGIDYCHKNEILHLDLKPANILVCENVCKICDFGSSMKISNTTKLPYTFKGTVGYADPEILMGKLPTAKSDIYSIGIIVWQLRSRIGPYEGLDNEVIIYKVVKFNFRPNKNYPDDVDKFSELYSSCWHENPNLRPGLSEIRKMLFNIV